MLSLPRLLQGGREGGRVRSGVCVCVCVCVTYNSTGAVVPTLVGDPLSLTTVLRKQQRVRMASTDRLNVHTAFSRAIIVFMAARNYQ